MDTYQCRYCNSKLTRIVDEHDYQRWECRGGEPGGMMPDGCGAFLVKREENGWKEEWNRKENI
ncbi:hypothetical protein [Sporosarcina sp. ZBG7A]|uniref:hypothetical protein n=1 Tax=Sporosarcina sp. ZBG7A TaxID=1582223 RepID=UPI00057A1BE2|nr:hypothetical protein [Sporosarcina sp. ZBG7A]